MDNTSLQSPSESSLASPPFEVEILDGVSQMTLEEPSNQKPANFQTPLVRKRKPSFVVTPPRVPAIAAPRLDFDESVDTESSFCQKPSHTRGTPPMLPGSPELDAPVSHNPFGRHRPLHSPAGGVSHLNVDFLNILPQLSQGSSDESSKNGSQRIERNGTRPPSATCHQLAPRVNPMVTVFPELDDDDGSAERKIQESTASTRALKMRRRNSSDYAIFHGRL